MATAAERELRLDLDIVQPAAQAAPLAVPPTRFSCGCRDCAISREERALIANMTDRGSIRRLRAIPPDGNGSNSEVLLHAAVARSI